MGDEIIGATIGQYEIAERLGEGAMGVVYRAVDRKLGRQVALKFLPFQTDADDEQRALFLQEARSAAAVEHPHIATVYEVGETPDGRPFISMPFYAGKTLAQRIQAGAVAVDQALGWTRQAAQGLERAHGRGLVHRDIKPANLALDEDGAIKILDFGIAQLNAGLSTRSHTSAGTAAYLSPEQAQDAGADHRADLWALGVVLYELLSGQLPFQADYEAAMLYSIVNEDPPPVESLRSDVSEGVAGLVEKLLAKDPARRFQTARELIDAIDGLSAATAAPEQDVAPATGAAPSLAVLPLANLGGGAEDEYFSDGLTEELIATLSTIDGLHVVSRTSAFRFKGGTHDVREVGRQLNVSSVLEGSVRSSGKRVRVTVRLVDASNGLQRWSQRFDRELEDVFAIQDEIAQSIAERLRAGIEGASCTPPARPDRTNAAAYDAYLRGRQKCSLLSEESFARAQDSFVTALKSDPEFAPAESGLADLHVLRGFWGLVRPAEAWPKAKSHALRALAIDDQLAEAHTSLGAVQAVYDRDFEAARRSFERAIELRPSYVFARDSYARFYLAPMGDLARAEKEMRVAVELDPLCPMRSAALGWLLLCQRDYAGVRRQVQRVFELAPNYVEGLWLSAITDQMEGRFDAALATVQRGWAANSESPQALGTLARAHALAGHRNDACRLRARLDQAAQSTYVSPTEYAWISVALGELDETVEHLSRAYDAFDAICLIAPRMPALEPLYEHAGFQALVKRMGVPMPGRTRASA